MKKTRFIFATIIMMVLFTFSASAGTYYTEGCYTYRVENGEATITDVDISISGDVTIPSNLGGYSVTTIGDSAFYSCTDITSITIPDSVTTISDSAFYWCTKITSVSIPNSVLTIDNDAFAGCYDLSSVTIGDNVTTIGNNAFAGCAITSITIPKSVRNIGDYAFVYCRELVDIIVNSENQYYSNDKLGVLFNNKKTKLIQYPMGNDRTSYIIPNTVTSIGESAFNGSYNLTSITIPNSVIAIDDYAFFDCYNLTNLTIPNSVTTIGKGALLACLKLESIELHSSVTTIGDAAFSNCTSLTDVYYFGSEKQWKSVSIDINNECLINANIHFLGLENHEHFYTYVITKPANHLTEGVKTYTCTCGDSYTEVIAKTKEHSYFVLNIVEPTCETEGYTTYRCECGHSYNGDKIPAKGHSYVDGVCKNCSDSKIDGCSCNCHKSGFMNIIWKIILIFQKIFKINKTCACGIAHY